MADLTDAEPASAKAKRLSESCRCRKPSRKNSKTALPRKVREHIDNDQTPLGRQGQGSPARQERHDQNRKTIPADGCAVCVVVLVFKAASPKSGEL
jgi:hypothetical protein